MDRLKQIEAFASVATRGSLSAAARVEGVTPAIIGRRIDALEARLGVRLLLRTTRKLTLTFEGRPFSKIARSCSTIWPMPRRPSRWAACRPAATSRCRPRLVSVDSMSRHWSAISCRPTRRCGSISNLSDRLVDLINENIDCAIRIGELTDSSLISVRLGEMRRMVVASPASGRTWRAAHAG